MTNTIILDNFLPGNLHTQCLNAIHDHHKTNPQDWSRYDNPWEHKTVLTKKLPSPTANNRFGFPPPLSPTFDIREAVIATCLERMRLCAPYFSHCLQPNPFHQIDPYQWVPDDTYHYDGVFIYGPGDYLSMHLDAGINPINSMRKHATATLYLTHSPSSPLRIWRSPKEVAKDLYIDVIPNRLVCFINDDNAWHGAPDPVGNNSEKRVVLTVSFMSPAIDLFNNKRTRAYFADTGNPDIDKLRDARSQEGHNLYRMEKS